MNIISRFMWVAAFITLSGWSLPLFAQNDHDSQYGVVDFPISCNEEAKEHFEPGLAMLHHMMYDQARTHFEAAVDADPNCAMAHWGIASTHFQPLWHPTSDEGLERGEAAIQKARRIGAPTEREQSYINAVDVFFTDPQPPADDRSSDHEARVNAWMEAQREIHESFPDDVDAAAFYALSELSYAMTQFSPDERRDLTRERRAGALLESYLKKSPEHPGLYHYLIHAYDSARLASQAEDVARGYDKLAPSTPHALHMPSHIFVRLGLWEETAEWNERSAQAALDQPVNGLTSLHYPHALDYAMYAYLQLGDEAEAKRTLARIRAINEVQRDIASAYNIAAAQARYHLEQQKWEDAASVEPGQPDALQWEDYPAAEALFYYTRGLGAARSGRLDQAREDHEQIQKLVAVLREKGNTYWAHMTEALGKAVNAWILYEEGKSEKALAHMSEAADQEDSMDKHPITPGEVLPVRELYAELLLLEGYSEDAAKEFGASLDRTPNRYNALKGLERARTMR